MGKGKCQDISARKWSKLNIDGQAWWVKEYIERFKGSGNVLDFGCGAGRFTRLLKSLGYCSFGVDVCEGMILESKRLDPTGNYQKINKDNLPFEENFFDFSICIWVLIKISNLQEIKRILLNIRNCSKTDSRLITVVHSKDIWRGGWIDSEFIGTQGPLSSGDKYKVRQTNLNNVVMDSIFWEEEDYESVFKESGWELEVKTLPMGERTDPINWKTELIFSPMVIFDLVAI